MASDDSGNARKQQAISIGTKRMMRKKLSSCKGMVIVACSLNMNRSTVSSIYKVKGGILKHVKSAVFMCIIISNKRSKLIKVTVSATSLYVFIDPLIMCRVSTFRLPDTVLGVVSDYVISLLVAIQLL